ncbi:MULTISPECIES: hypothetical protein [Sorangium]|uniref:Uncharacterized protein n=1 Tax=Sorangium cellulosum TaxID=56 RepID=A0A4P2QXG0_SORCE|nr:MULTISPECIES: hypothetical protein [Sorangium]AUX35240.1 uncharacterized protein SOCE836_074300 [Sorangium cellulosum]WCQ94545.1 hypothetical protein NQZ70_07313 [Sorangium sp. Soce836]
MPDYHASVEDFAALRASMDDPFGDPTACLAGAGLDERSYAELTGAWRARLALEGDAGRELGRRFAIAYRQAQTARRARAGGEDGAPRAEDARFLSRDAQPWRAEAAQVALVPSSAPSPPEPPAAPAQRAVAASTATDEAGPANAAASSAGGQWETSTLPVFSPEPSAPVLPFISPEAPRASPPPPGPRSPLAGLPFQPRPAAEIAIPPQPAAPEHLDGAAPAPGAPPRKRLMRFDPQTGQPLPYPVWVDVAPAAGEERKR